MTATTAESVTAFSTVGFIVIFSILLRILFCGVVVYLVFLLIKALRKYLGERSVSQETVAVRKSLGETIKATIPMSLLFAALMTGYYLLLGLVL